MDKPAQVSGGSVIAYYNVEAIWVRQKSLIAPTVYIL
jgi:hypothetical protein